MRLEDYKKAMESLALDEDIKQSAYRRICRAAGAVAARSGRKYLRLPVTAAAAVVFILVGAVTVFSVGAGILRLKEFFSDAVERSGADIDIIDSAEGYGCEENITASAENLSASIVGTACDGHYIVAIIDVDASECDIPDEAVPTFRRFSDNFHGGTVGLTLLSRSGSVFTYAYYNFGFAELPDGGEIILGGFGYRPDGGGFADFVLLSGEDLVFDIKRDELNMLEAVGSSEAAEIEGITVSAELSSLGLLLRLSGSPTEILGIEDGDAYMNLYNLEVHMRDGSARDFDSGIFRSQNGWIDRQSGGYCEYIGFIAPIDISEIESVSFHGVKFEFDGEKDDE